MKGREQHICLIKFWGELEGVREEEISSQNYHYSFQCIKIFLHPQKKNITL